MIDLLNIPDAIALQTQLNSNPTNFNSLAIAQMAEIRQSQVFRGRAYVVPETSNPANFAINTYATYRTHVRLIPNSFIWGLAWSWAFDTGFGYSRIMSLTISDQCTGEDFFSDFVLNSAMIGSYTQSFPSYVLPRPRLVGAPGEIIVQISNGSSNVNGVPAATGHGQLIIFVSEPAIRELAGEGFTNG